MYYSAICVLAAVILLIENQDILFHKVDALEKRAWKIYRSFLIAIFVYYIADIIWGILKSKKLSVALFIDTSVYFIAMAAGVVLWTMYIVLYFDEKSRYGRFLIYAGRVLAALTVVAVLCNFFYPVMFAVDEGCVYRPLPLRYAVFGGQIILLVIISAYALFGALADRKAELSGRKYRTPALFGLIMAFCLSAQFWYTDLPLYAVAYLLGTTLIRAFLISDEKEEYRLERIESAKIMELKKSLSSFMDNMPALSFSKDAETGVYLACNQAFAEYAHKSSPEGVVGLTDAEIFDAETARHFVEDDKMALSMDKPYIFFEDVPDAVGNKRQFQTTKIKYTDPDGKLCTLGMCQDVTDLVRVQREHATTKEAYEKAVKDAVIYNRIAQTLVEGYAALYYVNVRTGEFVEYTTGDEAKSLNEARKGGDFFRQLVEDVKSFVHPDDRDTVVRSLGKETLLSSIDENKNMILTFRQFTGQNREPIYVNLKASRVKEDPDYVIIGSYDVDEQIKQRREAEQIKEEQIAYKRLNALAGEYICIYVVDPVTWRYRLFNSTEKYADYVLSKDGENFFETTRSLVSNIVYKDDETRFLSLFKKDDVMAEIRMNGMFSMSYRIVHDGNPTYARLKAVMVEESDGQRLIVGLSNVDAYVRQEEDYARRLAKAQNIANVDALTGIRNRHAYEESEEKMNRQIGDKSLTDFAIVILDVNDLKKVNDTEGHVAGDNLICKAAKTICDIFAHSPVFRVGGDEFAVIAKGSDLAHIDALVERVAKHNEQAIKTGGVVVACGMARFEKDEKVAAVYERADHLMYENKKVLKAINAGVKSSIS